MREGLEVTNVAHKLPNIKKGVGVRMRERKKEGGREEGRERERVGAKGRDTGVPIGDGRAYLEQRTLSLGDLLKWTPVQRNRQWLEV